MKRGTRRLAIALSILAVLVAVIVYIRWPSRGHPSAFVPPDTALHKKWLYFYPARQQPRRAVMIFFGNDVAFWAPHQDLAWRLSGEGIDVVGIDLRRFLATLPSDEPQRDNAFAAAILPLMNRARRALSADSLPLILAGHSFGAEVALWVAEHRPPPGLVGVVAMSSRSSGHFVVTLEDLANKEASGRWAFSTIDAVRRIAPNVRIALIRGSDDRFAKHDPAFIAAGGARLRKFYVPFAGHSLKSLVLAGFYVDRAVDYLVDSTRH